MSKSKWNKYDFKYARLGTFVREREPVAFLPPHDRMSFLGLIGINDNLVDNLAPYLELSEVIKNLKQFQ